MATIATHNGSKVCREHNIRNSKVVEKESHIDPTRVHEIWHDEKIRDAYERIFGDAQREYNERQKREERKIKSYYNNVENDAKKHVAYEMIVGVYGKDVSDEQKKEILREFHEDWQHRNPSLEMIGSYFHADEEGDLHIHVDYIPVGHGYTRGMAVQNGLNKALEEMGFKTVSASNTAQIQWERRENLHLEELCKKRGIAVEHPDVEKQVHVETDLYKKQKELEELERKIDEKKKELEHLEHAKGPIGRIGPLKAKIENLLSEHNALVREVEILKDVITTQETENEVLRNKLEREIERQKELKPSIDDILKRSDEEKDVKILEQTVKSLEQEKSRLQKLIEKIFEFLKECFPEAFKALNEFLEKHLNHDAEIDVSKGFENIFNDSK